MGVLGEIKIRNIKIILIVIAMALITSLNLVHAYPDQGGVGGKSDSNSSDRKIVELLELANKELNKKYVYGATGPSTYDCSGFTQAMYKGVGVTISRVSHDQSTNGHEVARDSIQGGDLIFFKTTAAKIGHVGIYLGNNKFIHASSGGGKVMISDLETSSYYKSRYVTARRVIDGTNVPEGSTTGGGSEYEFEFNIEEIKSIKDKSSGTGLQYEQTDGDIVVNYKLYRYVKLAIAGINTIVHLISYLMVVVLGMLWAMYVLALSGVSVVNSVLVNYTKIDVYDAGTMQKMISITVISTIIIAMVLTGAVLGIMEFVVLKIMEIRI